MQSLIPIHCFLFEIEMIKNGFTGPINYRSFEKRAPGYHAIFNLLLCCPAPCLPRVPLLRAKLGRVQTDEAAGKEGDRFSLFLDFSHRDDLTNCQRSNLGQNSAKWGIGDSLNGNMYIRRYLRLAFSLTLYKRQ